MKRWLPGCALLLCTMAHAQDVFVWNPSQLKANKQKVAQKDPALAPAYKQLLKEADKAMKEGPFSVMEKKNDPPSGSKHDFMSLAPYFWPDPSKPDGLPYIRHDGRTNPEVKEYKDKEYLPRLCDLVPTLALAYYFSGKESYAQHAEQLIRVWFLDTATRMNPNLNYAQAIRGVNDGRGAGLIDARHFIPLIDAIGLLQGSKSWTAADQQGMQAWFAQFLNWMQTSKNGTSELHAPNNHGTWYDALRLSQALYTGNTELAKSIVDNVKKRLDSQMDDEGKFPLEMERTIALHYNNFDLEAFFLVASMAEKININLWEYISPGGKSLEKGFHFLLPYLTKQKAWTGQQIKDFDFGEGYFILTMGAQHYNCTECPASIAALAGDKSEQLRIHLIY